MRRMLRRLPSAGHRSGGAGRQAEVLAARRLAGAHRQHDDLPDEPARVTRISIFRPARSARRKRRLGLARSGPGMRAPNSGTGWSCPGHAADAGP